MISQQQLRDLTFALMKNDECIRWDAKSHQVILKSKWQKIIDELAKELESDSLDRIINEVINER